MKISLILKNAVLAPVILGLLFFASCVTCKVCTKPEDFNSLKGRVWQLAKVSAPSGAITFDASKLDKTKFGDIYTLQFDNSIAAGKAAPNRFRAPYELGKGDAISFKQAASTLMLGIYTPDGLNESEFFKLLEKAARWSFKDDVLSFYTSDGNVLIFNEFDYRK